MDVRITVDDLDTVENIDGTVYVTGTGADGDRVRVSGPHELMTDLVARVLNDGSIEVGIED